MSKSDGLRNGCRIRHRIPSDSGGRRPAPCAWTRSAARMWGRMRTGRDPRARSCSRGTSCWGQITQTALKTSRLPGKGSPQSCNYREKEGEEPTGTERPRSRDADRTWGCYGPSPSGMVLNRTPFLYTFCTRNNGIRLLSVLTGPSCCASSRPCSWGASPPSRCRRACCAPSCAGGRTRWSPEFPDGDRPPRHPQRPHLPDRTPLRRMRGCRPRLRRWPSPTRGSGWRAASRHRGRCARRSRCS